MGAPLITIGLPVYNGADLVAECLDALLAQTHRDFRVMVFDNASTDATPDIIARYATKDSRIVHHRQPKNVGAGQNFLDVLAATESPYFLWRADDDLSSENYLEHLLAKLDGMPSAALAVPCVRQVKPNKKMRDTAFIDLWPGPRIVTILRRMFLASPAWIYGLWRTEALRRYYLPVWDLYPYPWANDHLVLLQVILDEVVTGDNRAVFYQRVGMRANRSAPKRRPYSELIAEKTKYMHEFRSACRGSVAERDWGVIEGIVLRLFIDAYSAKRVNASEGKILRLKIRRALFGDLPA